VNWYFRTGGKIVMHR